jgi:hypothetical protein
LPFTMNSKSNPKHSTHCHPSLRREIISVCAN